MTSETPEERETRLLAEFGRQAATPLPGNRSRIQGPNSLRGGTSPGLTRVGLGTMFESMLQKRPGTCGDHGDFEDRGIGRAGQVRWIGCPVCSESARRSADSALASRFRREAEAEAAAKRAESVRERLGAAAIPPVFEGCTFGNYSTQIPGQALALAAARDYADNFGAALRTGRGLLFLGGTGTGKGHLAASILRQVAQEHSVQYVRLRDMVAAVRDTWRRESAVSEVDTLRLFGRSLDLLVIDEVGVQSGTENERSIVFDVLDSRYLYRRPTICITNLQRAEFAEIVGDRVYSRMKQTFTSVVFDWEDQRPKFRSDR